MCVETLYQAYQPLLFSLAYRMLKMFADKFTFSFATINGSPGLILTMDDDLKYVYSFAFNGNRIQTIYIVGNPDKLRHLQ